MGPGRSAAENDEPRASGAALRLPAWSRPRDLVLIALAVTAVIGLKLLLARGRMLATELGDTDDAMRLVLVRELLHGRGWYDQLVLRLQPPFGVYMHWSRLLDGALAGYEALLGIVLPPARAEWFMRLSWPLLWLLPTVAASLAIARRIGGGRTLSAAAVLFLLSGLEAFVQFAPGRVDHHNVQIALCVAAAAAALWSHDRDVAAIAAGAASALGLAVGLEAVLLYGAIGAAIALRFVFDRSSARAAMLYGLSLSGTCLAVFLLQTPPQRWGVSACDALGANLALTLSLGGGGLGLAVWATRGSSPLVRAIAISAAGLFAVGAGLALDPACRAGPIAAVDPRVRGFWFDRIAEMAPWRTLLAQDFDKAVGLAAPCVLGLLAWAWLGRRGEARSFAWTLTGIALLIATASTVAATRMSSYVVWFALPLIACAATDLSVRYGRGLLVTGVWLAFVASPPASAWAVDAIHAAATSRPPAKAQGAVQDACLADAAYGTLSRQPAGVVLGEPDIGPFVLALTPHSVLSAPYHRMTWGILTAHALLQAPADQAQAAVRRAGVSYVAVCPGPGGEPAARGSLKAALEAGAAPAWLRPVSPARDRLKVYAVRF